MTANHTGTKFRERETENMKRFLRNKNNKVGLNLPHLTATGAMDPKLTVKVKEAATV